MEIQDRSDSNFKVVKRLGVRANSLEEGDCNPIYKALHHTTCGAKVPSVSSSEVP